MMSETSLYHLRTIPEFVTLIVSKYRWIVGFEVRTTTQTTQLFQVTLKNF